MHLDEGTIHAWLDGALDAEEAARVERHAAECATCGAAVAEARGLVAASSRILSALDHVPGNVTPKTATAGASGGARQARPLWRVLHLTPARAAAAALIFVAAGTALVLRNQPNAKLPMDTEAGPEALESGSAPPLKVDVPAVVTAPPARAPAPPASMPKAPTPEVSRKGKASTFGAPKGAAEGAMSGSLTTAAAARATAQQPAADTRAVAGTGESVAQKRAESNQTAPAAQRSAKAIQSRGIGEIASAAPAPVALRAQDQVAAAPTSVQGVAGCYSVEADSTSGLPKTVTLDTARAGHLAAVRLRVSDVAEETRYAVSAVAARDATRNSFASAFWQLARDGTVRLYLGGRAPEIIALHRASPTLLTGVTTIDGRRAPVRLVRLPCA